MTTQVLETPTEEISVCRHYWIVEQPSGSTSSGVCKICGATRSFPNSAQGFVGEAERSASLASQADREITKLVEEHHEAA